MMHFVSGIPTGVEVDAGSDNPHQLSPEEEKVKELELLAVKKAEAHQLEEALELLNQGVSLAPGYASVYNNRAQVNNFSPFRFLSSHCIFVYLFFTAVFSKIFSG